MWLPPAGRLAGALIGLKTAEGRHEALLAMLRTTPASLFMPVLRAAPLPHPSAHHSCTSAS